MSASCSLVMNVSTYAVTIVDTDHQKEIFFVIIAIKNT